MSFRDTGELDHPSQTTRQRLRPAPEPSVREGLRNVLDAGNASETNPEIPIHRIVQAGIQTAGGVECVPPEESGRLENEVSRMNQGVEVEGSCPGTRSDFGAGLIDENPVPIDESDVSLGSKYAAHSL